jgi:hypothetical protein
MELGVAQLVSKQMKIIVTMFRTVTGSDNYIAVKAVQLAYSKQQTKMTYYK